MKDKQACTRDISGRNLREALLPWLSANPECKVRTHKSDWWCCQAEKHQTIADNHGYCGLFVSLKVIYGPKNSFHRL